MYQVEIENTVSKTKTTIIPNGEQLVENDVPVFDDFGNPVMIDSVIYSDKTAQEIADDEAALKAEKAAEIQAKIDAYKAAQAYQLHHGGPGPCAEFEVMKIVNEHNAQFEVIFK